MSEIEKMKRYIDKYGAPSNPRYSMSMREVLAVAYELGEIDAVNLAFVYGQAKGYRAAKAEVRKGGAA